MKTNTTKKTEEKHICPNPLVVNKYQWKMFEDDGWDMSHFVLDNSVEDNSTLQQDQTSDWRETFRDKWEGANSGSLTIDGMIEDIQSLLNTQEQRHQREIKEAYLDGLRSGYKGRLLVSTDQISQSINKLEK